MLTSSSDATQYKVLIVNLDPETGALDFDTTFRDRGSGELGVSFERSSWPHGEAGPAKPHGAAFSRVRNARRKAVKPFQAGESSWFTPSMILA